MLIRPRRRRRRRGENPEEGWEKPPRREGGQRALWILGGGLALLGTVVFGVLVGSGGEREAPGAGGAAGMDETRGELESAESVARAFLAETDAEKRLRWVHHPEEVGERMMEYSEEARTVPGEIDKVIGHARTGGRQVTAFGVKMPSGKIRLLEVVETPEGPRVDWDAYARHGTASWEELWSGKAERAVARVFCQPSTEAPEPFDAREKWTGFRMSSPDLPQAALGFAEVGTAREAMMKKVVLGTPNYRQRFVLEVVRHQGKSEPLFEIMKCLAVGWVTGEQPVEETWEEDTVGGSR